MNQSVETRTPLPVYYPVVTHVPFAEGSLQKKDIIPEHHMLIKSVKGVSCVNQLCSANVPPVAPNPPVGSRLHEFWVKWAALAFAPRLYQSSGKATFYPSGPDLT